MTAIFIILTLSFPGAASFAEIFQKASRLYGPVAAEAGGTFRLESLAESDSVVAHASRDSLDEYKVVVHGGMLRSPRLSEEALRMAICHEIGHLFGGDPLREAPPDWTGPVDPRGWALLSGEGQSDFYASLVCFRNLVAGETHRDFLKERPHSVTVERACREAWGRDSEGEEICRRAAWAAFDLLRLVAPFPVSFETPDPRPVSRTLRGEYPSRQCRLDTALAGAACAKTLPLDLREGSAEACPRPSCWFAGP